MFNKLKFKVQGIVIIIFTLGSLIISITTYFALKSIVYNNFVSLSSKSYTQNIDNITMYRKLIEESSKLITQNTNILGVLTSPYVYNISTILDITQTSYPGILGVALIDASGNEYLSDNVAGYPKFDTLISDKQINSFLLSKDKSYWSVRNEHIAKYYGKDTYNEKLGAVSFITKIYDINGKRIGLLCIDIKPSYIQSLFLDGSSDFISNSRVYISIGQDDILPHKNEDNTDVYLKNSIVLKNSNSSYHSTTLDKKYILLYDTLFNNNKAVLAVPLTPLYMELNQLIMLLIIINLLVLTLSYLIGRILSNSISDPLTKLHKKMLENSF